MDEPRTPVEQEQSTMPEAETTAQTVAEPVEPTAEKSKKSKKWLLLTITSVVLIAAALAFVFFGTDVFENVSGSVSNSTSDDAYTLFHSGLVPASTSGKWGYVDKTGKYSINPQFDYASDFADNGLACVGTGGKYGYIDKTGSYVINPQFDAASNFTDSGSARVKTGDKYGYIDKTGKYVVNPQFDGIGSQTVD